ncbi:MAG: 50S ribosomal protein L24 [Bdellovibrionales bacterium]|nr:50S ribosomal protein L24 [Bdellovibrionales bacterium]
MPSARKYRKNPRSSRKIVSDLRQGDIVMAVAGGSRGKRQLKGQTGKILRFLGGDRSRAIVEGLNIMTRHQRQTQPGKPTGKIQREAPIHVSNLMYYVEKLKQPVRIKHTVLADGKKVRGYQDPKSNEFVQIVDEAK